MGRPQYDLCVSFLDGTFGSCSGGEKAAKNTKNMTANQITALDNQPGHRAWSLPSSFKNN